MCVMIWPSEQINIIITKKKKTPNTQTYMP